MDKFKFKVALMKDPVTGLYTDTVDTESEEFDLECLSDFVKWLTDWQEVEIDG